MSVTKQYLKKNGKCKVTLSVPKVNAGEVSDVAVLGDFNDWDPEANHMKHLKNGSFKATFTLQRGQSYQFRYLFDGDTWENDPEADDQVPNFHGSRNSVIHL